MYYHNNRQYKKLSDTCWRGATGRQMLLLARCLMHYPSLMNEQINYAGVVQMFVHMWPDCRETAGGLWCEREMLEFASVYFSFNNSVYRKGRGREYSWTRLKMQHTFGIRWPCFSLCVESILHVAKIDIHKTFG